VNENARARETDLQGAVRLLFLLDRAGDRLEREEVPEAVRVIRLELRVQAMDLWMRNPDYLAYELLEEIRSYRRSLSDSDVDLAVSLLGEEEQNLWCCRMVKLLFGAYEAIDNRLSILLARSLADRRGKELPTGIIRSDFYLLAKGEEAARKLLEEEPVMSWYADRAVLVGEIAGTSSGNELKKRQYERKEYAETRQGKRTGAITARELPNEIRTRGVSR